MTERTTHIFFMGDRDKEVKKQHGGKHSLNQEKLRRERPLLQDTIPKKIKRAIRRKLGLGDNSETNEQQNNTSNEIVIVNFKNPFPSLS